MLRLRRFWLMLFCCALVGADFASGQVPPATKPSPSPTPAANSTPAAPTIPAPAAHALTSADLETFFDGIIPLQLERSDIAGATVLVMKDGQTLLKKGYGYSDFKNKKPVDPNSTIFRLASISKLFTWTSVMQLAEQGKLDIDMDINQYLDFQIPPAFGKPITLRNLMTHTGGFEEEVRDIILTDPRMASSLRDFLIHNQPRRIFPPGQIPAYSNYGVGLGGYIVQRVSGEPFERYVAEHIFQPLAMTHSSFHQPLQSELTMFPSDGYKTNTEKPAVGFEIFNPAPAGGISSTALDMGRFGEALLNGGELDGHRILKTETLNLMWTRQFAASEELPAICMGFYQTWRNGLHFIGHDGDLIAFHSMFMVEPKEKLILFISYNSAGSASKTRGEILNSFTDRYYPFTAEPKFQTFPLEGLKGIVGTYQPTRRSESNKLKLGGLISQAHAAIDKDGVLTVDTAKDLRGHSRKFKPIGKDLWQAVDDQPRIFAIRDSSGRVVRIASMFAGSQAERVPWFENAQWIGPAVGVSFATLLLVVIAALVRLGRKLFFTKRAQLRPQPGTMWITAGPLISAFAWIVLAVVTGIYLSALDNESTLPTHAVDKMFLLINALAGIAIFFSLFGIGSGILVWRRENLRMTTRIKFSLVGVSCLFLTWFAIHWNVIGPAHRF
jgi:CubicO group peptidase (beta-lactamase class C family)